MVTSTGAGRAESCEAQVQQRGDDAGGPIIGGIAVGLLGNQVGHGNGRTAATAAKFQVLS